MHSCRQGPPWAPARVPGCRSHEQAVQAGQESGTAQAASKKVSVLPQGKVGRYVCVRGDWAAVLQHAQRSSGRGPSLNRSPTTGSFTLIIHQAKNYRGCAALPLNGQSRSGVGEALRCLCVRALGACARFETTQRHQHSNAPLLIAATLHRAARAPPRSPLPAGPAVCGSSPSPARVRLAGPLPRNPVIHTISSSGPGALICPGTADAAARRDRATPMPRCCLHGDARRKPAAPQHAPLRPPVPVCGGRAGRGTWRGGRG